MAQWLRCCATNRKVAGSIPTGVIEMLHWHKIPPIALWPWGRLSLLQKWVPGAFPGDKGGRCVRLTTLPPSCSVVMKSGNFNFLEPSWPLQACGGTALSSIYYVRNNKEKICLYSEVVLWRSVLKGVTGICKLNLTTQREVGWAPESAWKIHQREKWLPPPESTLDHS